MAPALRNQRAGHRTGRRDRPAVGTALPHRHRRRRHGRSDRRDGPVVRSADRPRAVRRPRGPCHRRHARPWRGHRHRRPHMDAAGRWPRRVVPDDLGRLRHHGAGRHRRRGGYGWGAQGCRWRTGDARRNRAAAASRPRAVDTRRDARPAPLRTGPDRGAHRDGSDHARGGHGERSWRDARRHRGPRRRARLQSHGADRQPRLAAGRRYAEASRSSLAR